MRNQCVLCNTASELREGNIVTTGKDGFKRKNTRVVVRHERACSSVFVIDGEGILIDPSKCEFCKPFAQEGMCPLSTGWRDCAAADAGDDWDPCRGMGPLAIPRGVQRRWVKVEN